MESAEKLISAEEAAARGGEDSEDLTKRAVGSMSPSDARVLDFLRLLEEYRRKCENEGNYAEANKARDKYYELMKKETKR